METTIFVWMVAIPLLASLMIYLLGRLGVQQDIIPERSGLVHWSAFVAALITWIPFVLAVRDYFEQRSGIFHIELIWLAVDGLIF